MPVIKKVQLNLKPEERVVTKESKGAEISEGGVKKTTTSAKKFCYFCKFKSEPKYWDTSALRKYLSDRGRIFPRGRYGSCAKHQRRISREIKRARHLALLPFTARI